MNGNAGQHFFAHGILGSAAAYEAGRLMSWKLKSQCQGNSPTKKPSVTNRIRVKHAKMIQTTKSWTASDTIISLVWEITTWCWDEDSSFTMTSIRFQEFPGAQSEGVFWQTWDQDPISTPACPGPPWGPTWCSPHGFSFGSTGSCWYLMLDAV